MPHQRESRYTRAKFAFAAFIIAALHAHTPSGEAIPLTAHRQYTPESHTLTALLYDDSNTTRVPHSLTSGVRLNNYRNVQYYANIEVGSHKQRMSVIFDTGSDQLWVPTVDCYAEGQCRVPRGSSYYDYRKSDRSVILSEQEDTIHYGIGTVTGQLAADEVAIPGTAIRVPAHELLYVSYEEDLEGQQAAGVLGLQNSRDAKCFVDYAFDAQQITSRQFAFQIGVVEGPVQRQNSVLYIADDIPEDVRAETKFVRVTRANKWTIGVTGVTVGGEDFTSAMRYSEALVDTGTSLLLVSNALYSALYEKHFSRHCYVQRTRDPQSFVVLCSCVQKAIDDLPTIEFRTEDPSLVIRVTGNDYVLRVDQACMLGIQPLDGLETQMGVYFHIFGDVVLRRYVQTYDKAQKKIGFAPAPTVIEAPMLSDVLNCLFFVVVFALLLGVCVCFKAGAMKERPRFERLLYYGQPITTTFNGQPVAVGGRGANASAVPRQNASDNALAHVSINSGRGGEQDAPSGAQRPEANDQERTGSVVIAYQLRDIRDEDKRL